MDDDTILMQRVKQGDTAAFEALVERYEKPLINFIYRIVRNRHEAQDVAQEAFLRVYGSAGSYTASAKFSTYIYRVAYNLSVDSLRRKKTVESKDDGARDSGEGGASARDIPDLRLSDPLSDAEKRETSDTVRGALLKLPENQRAAIVLLLYEEKTYKEIGEILGVSNASVESLIFRARQGLRKILK